MLQVMVCSRGTGNAEEAGPVTVLGRGPHGDADPGAKEEERQERQTHRREGNEQHVVTADRIGPDEDAAAQRCR